MLRVFVRYPLATFDTDCLLPNYGYTMPHGGCTTPCGRCVQPLRGLPRVARASVIMSLRTVSFGSIIFKETLASMAFLPCSIVWWVLVTLTSPLALSIVSDMVMH